MNWPGWTPENIAEMKRRYAAGESDAQIAKALGAPSRNAIIGKRSRLGIARRGAGLSPPKSLGDERPTPAPRPVKRRMTAILKIIGGAVMEQAEAPPPQVQTKFREGAGGLRIIDPGFGGCRWPLNGEGAETRFCCARKAGDAYCADHKRIAYTAPSTSAKEFRRSLRRYA